MPMITPGMPQAADPDEMEQDEGGEKSEGRKIATIYAHDDGSFSLKKGDYDDDDEGEGEGEGGDHGDGGTETFGSVGPLLQAVLDCVKGEQGTEARDQREFNEGFTDQPQGQKQPAPPMGGRPLGPQRY